MVTIHRYANDKFEETLDLCESTGPYALTGAIFARDQKLIGQMMNHLRFAAGKFLHK